MWRISNSYEWSTLKSEFSWIRDMQGIPQDPVFHAEGDVETHTSMVVTSLVSMREYKELQEQDQHILFASALLHDVEKRSTTVTEQDGRITSRGHAKKGELTARNILYTQIPTPFLIREAITKLVRYHGLPLWIFEKPDPAKAAITASLEVNTLHLALLARADVLGRECPDKEELLYRIELFSELCREYECWGKPRYFVNGVARYNYLCKQETSPDYLPFDNTLFEVLMLSALPGSGKDTYLQSNFPDLPVVSLDDIRRSLKIAPTDVRGNGRVVQEAKEKAKTYMRAGTSFAWNATNTTRAMREQLIGLFTSYGGKVKITYLEVPYAKLKKQNSNRVHQVPEAVLQKMIRKLEVPSPVEAHEVEYIIDDATLKWV